MPVFPHRLAAPSPTTSTPPSFKTLDAYWPWLADVIRRQWGNADALVTAYAFLESLYSNPNNKSYYADLYAAAQRVHARYLALGARLPWDV